MAIDNLAYWSRKPPVVQPLPHNENPPVAYNKHRTYIAFLIGDGDNVAYLKHSRRDWITERLQRCANNSSSSKNSKGGDSNGSGGRDGSACPYPLLWTMSPHVTHLAPDWAQWYAQQLLKTKTDNFALPPSGHLYAYPSLFPQEQQEAFVRATERDCTLLATRVSTAWEVASSWGNALAEYFPRYAERGIVQSLVCLCCSHAEYALSTTVATTHSGPDLTPAPLYCLLFRSSGSLTGSCLSSLPACRLRVCLDTRRRTAGDCQCAV